MTPDEVMARHVAVERPAEFGNYEDAPIIQACRSCSYDCEDDPWYAFSIPWPCETYKVAERAKTAEAEMILPTWDNWMAWVEKTYPRDIFTETGDQPGSQIVWLTRHLREREARVTALEAVVRNVAKAEWGRQACYACGANFMADDLHDPDCWVLRAVELMEGE